MKNQIIIRLMMTLVLVFGVAASADAQLGKLKGMAKKAVKEKVDEVTNTVTNTGGNTTVATPAAEPGSGGVMSAEEAQANYRAQHPAKMEEYNVQQAGGMDVYLGLDQTENGRVVWKYASLPRPIRGSNMSNANSAASELCNILRWLKGNNERFPMYDQSTFVMERLNEYVPECIEKAKKPDKHVEGTVSAADIAALQAELARVKDLYLTQTGAK